MLKDKQSYWENLCPDLSIGKGISVDPIPFTHQHLAGIADHFWQTGYLKLDGLVSINETEILALALDLLKQADIPPVFLYMYDQPWALFERLRLLITHFLGHDYRLLPNLWAWHLQDAGEAGWPPHKDCNSDTVLSIGDDQMLMSLSLWVPLTDTDEANGCMFVVPRENEHRIAENADLTVAALKPLARALPAPAGSVLGWSQDLVHWGGRFSSMAAGPRKSLSFEFQNTSFDPLAEPLLETGHPPPFDQRLTLIKAQFEKYRHISGG